MVLCASAFGAPGQLDPTFGTNGLAAPVAGAGYGYATIGVGEQADGKYLISSTETHAPDPPAITLQRANADGSPDLTFGLSGVSRFPMPPGTFLAFASAVASTGEVAVTGWRGVGPDTEIFVVKFRSDGSVDSDFVGDASDTCAVNGMVCTQIDAATGQDQGRAIAFQGDGKLVVAGSSQHSSGYGRMGVVRYTSTGALDPTFSGDGLEQVAVGPWSSWADAVEVTAGGQIVLAGGAQAKGPNWSAADTYVDAVGLARLDSNGDVDPSFHAVSPGYSGPAFSDGVVLSPRLDWTYGAAYALALAAGGKLVVTGYANDKSPAPTGSSAMVLRLGSTGALDPTFGADGRAFAELGVNQAGRSLQLDSADRPLVSGFANLASGQRTFALRMTTDGALDPDFGDGGFRLLDGDGIGSDPEGLTTQDGRWLLAGSASGARWALVRMLMAEDPIAPVAALPPKVQITNPRSKKLRRSKLRRISGTAGPAALVQRVEIALTRVDAGLLRRSHRCLWLVDRAAKFKRFKAVQRRCKPPRYLRAHGKSSWSYRLTRLLPAGRYVLTVRATLQDGRSAAATARFRLK